MKKPNDLPLIDNIGEISPETEKELSDNDE